MLDGDRSCTPRWNKLHLLPPEPHFQPRLVKKRGVGDTLIIKGLISGFFCTRTLNLLNVVVDKLAHLGCCVAQWKIKQMSFPQLFYTTFTSLERFPAV